MIKVKAFQSIKNIFLTLIYACYFLVYFRQLYSLVVVVSMCWQGGFSGGLGKLDPTAIRLSLDNVNISGNSREEKLRYVQEVLSLRTLIS